MSGCPVDHGKGGDARDSSSGSGCPVKMDSSSSGWTGWLWGNGGGSGSQAASSSPSSSSSSGNGYNAPANDMAFGQSRHEGQTKALSTSREKSSIKKSDFSPEHQPDKESHWVYPSEQQYFNAMKRKGYDPKEEDMPVVLAIHNVVNEQGWSKVMEWERMRGSGEVKLKRFMGRPKDLSPKARLLNFMGYELPFDRHDWVVERANNETARYVLDFYKGNVHPGSKATIGMHLDVRPALDSPSALMDRIYVFGMSTILGNNPLRPRRVQQKPREESPPSAQPAKK